MAQHPRRLVFPAQCAGCNALGSGLCAACARHARSTFAFACCACAHSERTRTRCATRCSRSRTGAATSPRHWARCSRRSVSRGMTARAGSDDGRAAPRARRRRRRAGRAIRGAETRRQRRRALRQRAGRRAARAFEGAASGGQGALRVRGGVARAARHARRRRLHDRRDAADCADAVRAAGGCVEGAVVVAVTKPDAPWKSANRRLNVARRRSICERAYELAARGGSTSRRTRRSARSSCATARSSAKATITCRRRRTPKPTRSRRPGDARGATLYVSLEPCRHVGRTPPCTRRVVDAGDSPRRRRYARSESGHGRRRRRACATRASQVRRRRRSAMPAL